MLLGGENQLIYNKNNLYKRIASFFSGNVRRFRRICEHTQSVVSVVRRAPVQPPASPRVTRRNSSTRESHQPPSRSSIPVPTSNTNEVSDSSSCNSDVSPHPVLEASKTGTGTNGIQESPKIILGNGTSPTKSTTSITSLPKIKPETPTMTNSSGSKKDVVIVEAAPIATLEGTCEDLKEVKNGCDPPDTISTPAALADLTADVAVNNSAARTNPGAGSPPASTCMSEASPACV